MRQPPAWLLACTVATATQPMSALAQPVSAPAQPVSAPAQPVSEPPPPTEAATPDSGPGLRWPPLLLGGALALDIRQERTPHEAARQQRLLSATINGATFLYAPWLATLNGSISLTTGRSDSTVQEPGSPEPTARQDRFVSGGLRLDLFPRSRFPSELRYEVSDTRIDNTLPGGVDYRSRTLALSQRYRPVDGSFTLSASYERRAQDSPEIGEDSQESLLADFSTSWKRHRLAAMLARHVNRRGSTGEETDFLVTQLRHSYSDGAALSIDSAGNWARTSEHLQATERTLTLAQWNTIALWRSPVLPLQVSGSLRASMLQGLGTASINSLTLGAGASYEFSPRARLSGSLSATRLDGRTDLASVGQLSGSYQGTPRQIGPVNWDWFGGAAISAANTDGVQETTLSTQLGHTVSRAWQREGGSTVAASLSQTLSVSAAAGGADTARNDGNDRNRARALAQTGALSWIAQGQQGSAFVRLSLADARQFNGDRARFQLVNLQVSGTHELDRQRSWSGDLTLQRLVQRSMTVASPDEPALDPALRVITNGASGELTWRHIRVFDVPRLRFTARLRLSYDTLRQAQALLSVADRETASLEQRLDYQVGRLESSLSLLWSLADGRQRQTLQWRVQRNFGD